MKKALATLLVMSLIAALAISAATASGSGEEKASSAATAKTILVDDDRFKSGTLKIRRKVARVRPTTPVVFRWVGSNTHNVTGLRRGKQVFQSEDSDMEGFRYPTRGGKRFKRDTTIVCTIHPTTMKFKIDVVR